MRRFMLAVRGTDTGRIDMDFTQSDGSFKGNCKSAACRVAVWGLLVVGFLIVCVGLPLVAFAL